jgi:starch synthase
MRICFAISECVPFIKTGGLADVAGALPRALSQLGCKVKVFVPLYSAIDRKEFGFIHLPQLDGAVQEIISEPIPYAISFVNMDGTDLYFIDCPKYFHRAQLYTSDPDEAERFILFQKAILFTLQKLRWRPDIVHCNDWQTALLPGLLKRVFHWDQLFARTASVLSIHNLAYMGRFAPEQLPKTGLPMGDYYPNGPLEFQGSFSFLKAGISFADSLSTVSESYANEIQTPAYGEGLEGILSARGDSLFGILNGIDDELWSPATDNLIPENYTERKLASKEENKKALLKKTGLPYEKGTPVIGVISRLAIQKGFELLTPLVARIVKSKAQLVLLGSGEPIYEKAFLAAQKRHPKSVAVKIGFDNELAHMITAGADMFLMPSLYEPCGLNQMYSLNYGTVPIVRKTGGLADTVIDFNEDKKNGNGFSFAEPLSKVLFDAISRALTVYKDRATWEKLMLRGMKQDFSWGASAEKYLEMYETTKINRA